MALRDIQSDLTNLEFGKGKAYDQPNMGFSSEPFITTPIQDDFSNVGTTLNSLTGGLIRGGALTHTDRLLNDTERITKFMLTPKGLSFIAKQEGLQLSNPKISAPNVSISRANQRTYNLGINTLTQVAASGTGIHIKREGITPLAFEGYADAKKLRSDNENNRLIYLFEDKISYSTTQEYIPADQSPLGGFLSGVSSVINFISDLSGDVGEFLGFKEQLYSYSGGPNSLYGIGQTTIFRYDDTNQGKIKRNDLGNGHLGLGGFTTNNLIHSTADKPLFILTEEKGLNDQPEEVYGQTNTVLNEGIYKKILTAQKALGVGITNTPSRVTQYNLGDPGAPYTKGGRDAYVTGDRKSYRAGKVDNLNMVDVFKSKGETEFSGINDFIPFRFEAVNTNNPVNTDVIAFRAFLDTFTDNFNASHNEFNYNGRGETFYTYNGFKRNIAVSFKIAAQSRHELLPLYRKLNYLVSNTAPEYSAMGRMVTPFMRLTVGHWCDRIPGVLNSVGLSWQKDYPWEVSRDEDVLILPHVLDVTVGFTPIHNFIPEKGISSPFILPHSTTQLKGTQEWYKLGIEEDSYAAGGGRPFTDRLNDLKSPDEESIDLNEYNGPESSFLPNNGNNSSGGSHFNYMTGGPLTNNITDTSELEVGGGIVSGPQVETADDTIGDYNPSSTPGLS